MAKKKAKEEQRSDFKENVYVCTESIHVCVLFPYVPNCKFNHYLSHSDI